MIKKNLTLYYTESCHLCELAKNVFERVRVELLLEGADWHLGLIDIVSNEDLFELYGLRIPVVKAEGCEADLGWPFDADELKAYLLTEQSVKR